MVIRGQFPKFSLEDEAWIEVGGSVWSNRAAGSDLSHGPKVWKVSTRKTIEQGGEKEEGGGYWVAGVGYILENGLFVTNKEH